MLVLEFFVVNDLKMSAALRQVVSEVDALEDLLLVESLEWDHDIKTSKLEAIGELVGAPREIRNVLASDLVHLHHRVSLLGDAITLELIVV